jgi:hypothetical protein
VVVDNEISASVSSVLRKKVSAQLLKPAEEIANRVASS